MKQSDFDAAYENSNDEEPYQRLVNVAEGHGISMLNCQAYEILTETYGYWDNVVEAVSAMTDDELFKVIENFVSQNKCTKRKAKSEKLLVRQKKE